VGRRFEEAFGVRNELPPATFEASWLVQHFAYGAAGGIAYELAERRLKLPEPIPSGPLFGAALWVFGYAGWLPLTGLYPSPPKESARRLGTLVVTHLIYGTATAAASRLLKWSRGGVAIKTLPREDWDTSPAMVSGVVAGEMQK